MQVDNIYKCQSIKVSDLETKSWTVLTRNATVVDTWIEQKTIVFLSVCVHFAQFQLCTCIVIIVSGNWWADPLELCFPLLLLTIICRAMLQKLKGDIPQIIMIVTDQWRHE